MQTSIASPPGAPLADISRTQQLPRGPFRQLLARRSVRIELVRLDPLVGPSPPGLDAVPPPGCSLPRGTSRSASWLAQQPGGAGR